MKVCHWCSGFINSCSESSNKQLKEWWGFEVKCVKIKIRFIESIAGLAHLKPVVSWNWNTWRCEQQPPGCSKVIRTAALEQTSSPSGKHFLAAVELYPRKGKSRRNTCNSSSKYSPHILSWALGLFCSTFLVGGTWQILSLSLMWLIPCARAHEG